MNRQIEGIAPDEACFCAVLNKHMDTLGFEPRAFRMRSGCDTTTPCAPCMVRNLRRLKYQRFASPPYEACPLICHATHQRHYNHGHSQNWQQTRPQQQKAQAKPESTTVLYINVYTRSRPLPEHQWSSGRIHRCHRCDPGSIPG